jgi:hypothetical protein
MCPARGLATRLRPKPSPMAGSPSPAVLSTTTVGLGGPASRNASPSVRVRRPRAGTVRRGVSPPPPHGRGRRLGVSPGAGESAAALAPCASVLAAAPAPFASPGQVAVRCGTEPRPQRYGAVPVASQSEYGHGGPDAVTVRLGDSRRGHVTSHCDRDELRGPAPVGDCCDRRPGWAAATIECGAERCTAARHSGTP